MDPRRQEQPEDRDSEKNIYKKKFSKFALLLVSFYLCFYLEQPLLRSLWDEQRVLIVLTVLQNV